MIEISPDEYLPAKIRSIKPAHVPKTLSNPHPLVEKTYQVLKKAKPDKYGALRHWYGEMLDIRVSPKSLIRGLRILDGIIKALAIRGYTVTIEKAKFQDATPPFTTKIYNLTHFEKSNR